MARLCGLEMRRAKYLSTPKASPKGVSVPSKAALVGEPRHRARPRLSPHRAGRLCADLKPPLRGVAPRAKAHQRVSKREAARAKPSAVVSCLYPALRHTGKAPLFRSATGRTGTLTEKPMHRVDAWRMIQRRSAELGIRVKIGCHTFRATGITAYLEAGGTLENAQAMAAHESPRTTQLYDRTGDEITLDEVERITI